MRELTGIGLVECSRVAEYECLSGRITRRQEGAATRRGGDKKGWRQEGRRQEGAATRRAATRRGGDKKGGDKKVRRQEGRRQEGAATRRAATSRSSVTLLSVLTHEAYDFRLLMV